MKKSIFIVLGLQIFYQGVFAQSDVRTPSGTPLPKTIKEIREQNVERRMAAMRILSQMPRQPKTQKPKKMSAKDLKKFKKLTKPSSEDATRYKEFLKQKKTGIFRIMPDFDCETENLVKAGGDCKYFMPGSWLYSIRKKKYSDLDLHDLAFKRNRLVSNSLLTQGLMTSLGDVPLTEISLDRRELRFLLSFVPEIDKELARNQFTELSKGIKIDGVLYANNFAAELNNTYALRVIAYRFKDRFSTRLRVENIPSTPNGARFAAIRSDKRSDSVFVFRVISKGADGGITIVWKELQKQKSPQIVFEKTERLSGFKAKKEGK
ncbi:MAG: hypothetical protein HKN25_10100 [Pyrinomonadaceae bacterium]|nr:hypothetical protein [Pyrinomonadaceae bacterium]